MLVVRGLCKEYRRGGGTFYAVRDAAMSVGDGDFVCISGQSGGGKSTLLNMIAGLLEPTSGSITSGGRELAGMNDYELSLYRNERIGYIPQGQSILPNLSVIDNVLLPFYLYKKTGDPTGRAMTLLDRVGIAHLAEAYPAHLSGGELKRTAIARSLINSPKMLLADEPTVDLDPRNAEEVMKIFSDISRDSAAVILVTHEANSARWVARRFSMESGILKETT
ncbi:MAG: ABC transporter ATP-binding protein [Synergistaceae bacterium]|nr:ABC transporter ATP-binding protein [Synergistaceae bacterium]